MSDTNQNRPTHRLFTVNGDGEHARWTDIGVAWAFRSKCAFTLPELPALRWAVFQ
jgi:hypothetical protein